MSGRILCKRSKWDEGCGGYGDRKTAHDMGPFDSRANKSFIGFPAQLDGESHPYVAMQHIMLQYTQQSSAGPISHAIKSYSFILRIAFRKSECARDKQQRAW